MTIINQYLNGAVSGAFGIVISHPFDTIKTCIQDKKPTPNSFKHLYKGVSSAMLGVGLEKAVVFGTYETVRNITKKNNINNTNSIIISGFTAGLSASLIVTPTERIKILLQTGNNLKKSDFYPNKLYRGLSATFTREVPGFTVYFSTYNFLKNKYCNKYNTDIPLYRSFLYGGFSGAVSWLCIYPQDVIKTRIQSNNKKSVSYLKTIKNIYNEGGVGLFFKGFQYAFMRAIPLHAGTFMMMEFMKKYN